MKEDTKHEVYSLVKLQNIEICVPETAKPLPMVQKKSKGAKKKKIKKTKTKTKKKPLFKPNKKIEKKVVIVEEITSDEVEKLILEPEVEEETKTETPEILEEKTKFKSVEASTPIMAKPKPKISYEAQYMKDNIALINALIKKNLSYPRIAKKRGLQGKVFILFTLTQDGEVLDLTTTGSSSSTLKKSAVKTILKASKHFPRPSKTLVLQIPIVYKLH